MKLFDNEPIFYFKSSADMAFFQLDKAIRLIFCVHAVHVMYILFLDFRTNLIIRSRDNYHQIFSAILLIATALLMLIIYIGLVYGVIYNTLCTNNK